MWLDLVMLKSTLKVVYVSTFPSSPKYLLPSSRTGQDQPVPRKAMELSQSEKEAVIKCLDTGEPFSLELEKRLREVTRPRRKLTAEEREQVKKFINQGTPLSHNLQNQLFGTSPAIEFEKLKNLGDYTKFHLGLYITLLAAIIAFLTSELGPPIGSPVSLPFLATVFLLALAGAFGGMVGSHIPNHHSLTVFEETRLSKCLLGVDIGAEGRTWITLEHTAFWIGMLAMLAGLIWFAFDRSATARQSDVARVFTTFAEAWNRSDMAGAAALWAENGVFTSQSGEVATGHKQIRDRLSAGHRRAITPMAIPDPQIQFTDQNHAVATGDAKFNVRGDDGQVTSAADCFTASLGKTKAGWAIHSWLWTCPDPAKGHW
jgi:uncharacterized protein (TIGR02246 family)